MVIIRIDSNRHYFTAWYNEDRGDEDDFWSAIMDGDGVDEILIDDDLDIFKLHDPGPDQWYEVEVQEKVKFKRIKLGVKI